MRDQGEASHLIIVAGLSRILIKVNVLTGRLSLCSRAAERFGILDIQLGLPSLLTLREGATPLDGVLGEEVGEHGVQITR